MISDDYKARLDARLEGIGLQTLLADIPSGLINTVGGPADHRIYAQEWISKALAIKDRTDRLLIKGQKAIQDAVLQGLLEATKGSFSVTVSLRQVADAARVVPEEAAETLLNLSYRGAVRREDGEYGITIGGVEWAALDDDDESDDDDVQTQEEEEPKMNTPILPTGVFIGHGRDKAWHEVSTYLLNTFGIHANTFEREGEVSQEVIPTIKRLLDESAFAIIVATAEDETKDERFQARQNVVHETGLFQGRLGFDRVVMLVENGIQTYTNLSGLIYIPFDKGEVKQTYDRLGRALRRAGFIER